MIALLLLLPLAGSIWLFFAQSRRLNETVPVMYAGLYLLIALRLYRAPGAFTAYFKVDPLNVLFLLVLAVLFGGVAVYNWAFLRHDSGSIRSHAWYAMALLLFVFAMTGVILSTHLALLWVFIEATTLASAYLIYFNRTPAALEATWKYLFICSIGISLAFVGIILLSMGLGHRESLFFEDLYRAATTINPFWLKLSFAFILVGLGTKIGFAPVHAWLPDAHSESPSPISALLSGALLNVGVLGVLRVSKMMELANLGWYAQTLLLLMGFLSLFVTAVYIGNMKNYKRMLAYSSIEHMGIIAIGVGVGGIGVFAAMLHIVAHSLTKAALFLTAGNVLHRYGTKEIAAVRGLLRQDPLTGWLWLFSFAAIAGLPPFPLFLSEFLIVQALFANGRFVLAGLFFLLLTVILAGMGKIVFQMSFGAADEQAAATTTSAWEYAPQIVFLGLLLLMGAALPERLYMLLQQAAAAF